MANLSRSLRITVAAAGLLALFGCGESKKAAPEATGPVPETYRVNFATSRGHFVVQVNKSWAPEGAERFYRLIQQKFFDDVRFFRVVPNFVVQFGINGDPKVAARWVNMTIADDPAKESNLRGRITFATSGPNSRTTQVFINLKDNAQLDSRGFPPFGEVVEGMDIVDHLYNAYGEGAPKGNGPDQTLIEAQGNEYLNSKFPRLDYIKTARIVQ